MWGMPLNEARKHATNNRSVPDFKVTAEENKAAYREARKLRSTLSPRAIEFVTNAAPGHRMMLD